MVGESHNCAVQSVRAPPFGSRYGSKHLGALSFNVHLLDSHPVHTTAHGADSAPDKDKN